MPAGDLHMRDGCEARGDFFGAARGEDEGVAARQDHFPDFFVCRDIGEGGFHRIR